MLLRAVRSAAVLTCTGMARGVVSHSRGIKTLNARTLNIRYFDGPPNSRELEDQRSIEVGPKAATVANLILVAAKYGLPGETGSGPSEGSAQDPGPTPPPIPERPGSGKFGPSFRSQ